MTTTYTEVVAAETEREKGVCLCKQETHVEDSSRTIVKTLSYERGYFGHSFIYKKRER